MIEGLKLPKWVSCSTLNALNFGMILNFKCFRLNGAITQSSSQSTAAFLEGIHDNVFNIGKSFTKRAKGLGHLALSVARIAADP